MPLTLDATVGGPASNAYADEAAALLAASYRVGVDAGAFAALTSDQRIQALVTGAGDIDTLAADPGFLGERATTTQALEWPRTGTEWVGLPPNLVKANIELAIAYAPAFDPTFDGDVLNPDPLAGRVKRKKVDVLETEWFAPGDGETAATALERFPAMVQRLLAGLLRVEVTDQWGGSAEVTRGS